MNLEIIQSILTETGALVSSTKNGAECAADLGIAGRGNLI